MISHIHVKLLPEWGRGGGRGGGLSSVLCCAHLSHVFPRHYILVILLVFAVLKEHCRHDNTIFFFFFFCSVTSFIVVECLQE